MLPLPFLMLAVSIGQAVPNQTPAQIEMTRLAACHPTFKLSPPPLHMRFVWTQPFDLVETSEGKNQIGIEFSIQYAQSTNFATAEEASKAEDFNPNFDLRQRNHYAIEENHLRLLWRESRIASSWKRQQISQPEFACWQTIPNPPDQR